MGLMLAVAGNAIGLGNFLRFPRLAAEYGGGAFLVPYFIALLVLGVPLMWIEWTSGRFGGIFGHTSTPGIFGRMTRSRYGTMIGSLGVSIPLLFAIYYTYIESWTLAYATFSATKSYYVDDAEKLKQEVPPEIVGVDAKQLMTLLEENPDGITFASWPGAADDFEELDTDKNGLVDDNELAPVLKPLDLIHTLRFLQEYQGVVNDGNNQYFTSIYPAIGFWLIAIACNVFVLIRGIEGGIEILAKTAMPLLFIFAIFLVINVFLYGTPNPEIPTRSVWAGLDFVWKPNFSALSDVNVWLAAAGQIFFTLSIGTGAIHAYTSYLKKDDDCTLTGVATVTTNEFAEVVLGASIAIPIAVASFGLVATQAIAAGGTFNLGFVALPMIFEQMPLGQLLGTIWFLLLFFAGITSSVALCQPMVGFMQEAYDWSRKKSALVCGGFLLCFGFPIVLFLEKGYLDEYDNWIGTVGLVSFALIETVVFAWLFGYSNMIQELTRGHKLRIPQFYIVIMRYVVPVALSVMLGMWLYENFTSVVLMIDNGQASQNAGWKWFARSTMLAVIFFFFWLTIRSQSFRGIENEPYDLENTETES